MELPEMLNLRLRQKRALGLAMACYCCLWLLPATLADECRVTIADGLKAGVCHELVLDQRFGDWDRMPEDLGAIRIQAATGGQPIAARFVEGHVAARYGRWLLETASPEADGVRDLRLTFGDTPVEAPAHRPQNIIGGNLGQLPAGDLQNGRDVLGFTLVLQGHSWASVRPASVLFPGGPTASGAIPMHNDPSTPLLASDAFESNEIGHLGLRDFHVMTQPGGRACKHQGYYYALVSGHRLSEQQPKRGRKKTDRALMWTRAEDINGPWEKPKILLGPQDSWEVLDQGAMVKLGDDKFILMFRAVVGKKNGLYVITADSPTAFRLPKEPTAAVLDASVLDSLWQPVDYLSLPHMIKLTDESCVGTIPGTHGAFVAYFEVRRMHQGQSKWHVFGAYSTHPEGLADWTPINGGRPLCRPDDDPESAWHSGVANPKLIELGPNRFAFGVNAYGQNLPEYKTGQDWRLWLASSTDCTAFEREGFRCMISQYPGEGEHTGRIESTHLVMGPDEPLDGPLRVVYFAASMAVEPETHFCNIYQAFTPSPATAKRLELGGRGHKDRSFLYRKIDAGEPFTLELAVDAREMHRQRGQVFLPALLDSDDASRASGLAVVRDAEGQFRIATIENGKQTMFWRPSQQTFVPIPPEGPDRRFIARVAKRLRNDTIVYSGVGLLAFCLGALSVLVLFRTGQLPWKRALLAVFALGAVGAAVVLVIPKTVERDKGPPIWFGPKAVQRAKITLASTESSLSAQITGPQGRIWLTAELPRLDESLGHLFVGRATSAGKSMSTEIEYVLLHPPAEPLAL